MVFKTVGPPVRGFTWGQRLASLPPALPIVAVVVIIIFFVYNPFGDAWGTPTEGGAIGVQLAHAGRKAWSRDKGFGLETPVAPSAEAYNAEWATPHALTLDEIDAMVEAWQTAAQRALAVGGGGEEE